MNLRLRALAPANLPQAEPQAFAAAVLSPTAARRSASKVVEPVSLGMIAFATGLACCAAVSHNGGLAIYG